MLSVAEVIQNAYAGAKLVKTYFSKDIGDPRLYDVTWNTDSVSIEEIAASVIGLISSRIEREREVA